MIFFFFERSEGRTRLRRVNEAQSAEKKTRLPSEPAKRLIFSPTMRQRASGTRVWSGWVISQFAVSHMPSKILGKEIVHISVIFLFNFFI